MVQKKIKSGKHPTNQLSPAKLRTLTAPGRHADGNGLFLVIDPSGSKRWMLRTVVRNKRCDIGLGGLWKVSQSQARAEATKLRALARNGVDILEARRAEKIIVPTFEEAAREYFADHIDGKKSEKHAAQWINTLAEYAFPAFGKRRIDSIESPDIMRVLTAIWYKKPETAARVHQRIKAIFSWATKERGYRTGDNPAEGLVGKDKTLKPREKSTRGHHEALPYEQVAEFIKSMKASSGGEIPKLAFEFLILTAARTGEVLEATWDEIDLNNLVWTVPATRIKAKREHRVPLSQRCIEIVKRAKELAGESNFVFAGRQPKAPLSSMVFLMILRRMNRTITAHGFRSTFRVWCAERTSFPTEVCEASLAHAIADETVAAYLRTDFFERRRELMNTWALHVLAMPGKVINIREKKKTA